MGLSTWRDTLAAAAAIEGSAGERLREELEWVGELWEAAGSPRITESTAYQTWRTTTRTEIEGMDAIAAAVDEKAAAVIDDEDLPGAYRAALARLNKALKQSSATSGQRAAVERAMRTKIDPAPRRYTDDYYAAYQWGRSWLVDGERVSVSGSTMGSLAERLQVLLDEADAWLAT